MPDYFPPGGAGSFTPPTGSGFVKVTGGVLDTASSSLSATEIPVFWVATTTRSTNAFSGSLPTTPALVAGLCVEWQVPSAPSGAATYNLNSLGAKDIYFRGTANVAADLPANRIVRMIYDGTRWQVIACNTLLPGDMPAQPRLEAMGTAGESSTNGGYFVKNYDAATMNTGPAWSYSAGVFTCLIAGTYDFRVPIYGSSFNIGSVHIYKNSTTLTCCSSNTQAGYLPTAFGSVEFAVGETFQVRGSFSGTVFTINVSDAILTQLIVQRRA